MSEGWGQVFAGCHQRCSVHERVLLGGLFLYRSQPLTSLSMLLDLQEVSIRAWENAFAWFSCTLLESIRKHVDFDEPHGP